MKRFRSPLHQIQRVQHQLLRIAELNLAKALAELNRLDGCIRDLKQQQDEARSHIATCLTSSRPQHLLSARARTNSLSADIENVRRQREQLEAEVQAKRAIYQQLKARSDGVDQLVQTQKDEHRRAAFRDEQIKLDEAAQLMRAATTSASAAPVNAEIHEGMNS